MGGLGGLGGRGRGAKMFSRYARTMDRHRLVHTNSFDSQLRFELVLSYAFALTPKFAAAAVLQSASLGMFGQVCIVV